MSATAVCEQQVRVAPERRPCAAARGVTLGHLLTRAHEGVQAGHAADCPVCGGAMAPSGTGARCGDCGTRLV